MTGGEDTGARKRLRLRAWRRGTREMDLILGSFADARLAGMDAAEMGSFDALLGEDDHDLYSWVSGTVAPPPRHAALIGELSRFATERHRG